MTMSVTTVTRAGRSSWIRHLSPLSATGTMHVVGVIEIFAGVTVALKPRYAAYVVAAWLGGIVINLGEQVRSAGDRVQAVVTRASASARGQTV
jgi:hypothetical protein